MNSTTERFEVTQDLIENDSFISRFCGGCAQISNGGYCRLCDGEQDPGNRYCSRHDSWLQIKEAADTLEYVINDVCDSFDSMDAGMEDW